MIVVFVIIFGQVLDLVPLRLRLRECRGEVCVVGGDGVVQSAQQALDGRRKEIALPRTHTHVHKDDI